MDFGHGTVCAKWHALRQVPIDTLREMPIGPITPNMAATFRDALIWHMDQNKTGITELVDATGVSRDVINKLKARPSSSTQVETAMLIAAFYGKTVEQFIRRETVSDKNQLSNLFELMTPEERRLLISQIEGLLRGRGQG